MKRALFLSICFIASTTTLPAQQPRFPGAHYPSGEGPIFVALRDLDGDDLLDLVTVRQGSIDIAVRRGDGRGGFGAELVTPTIGSPVAAAIGDLDGDGVPDLAIANGSGTLVVHLATGLGAFSGASSFPVGLGPEAIELVDLDGDSLLDAVVANGLSNDVSVLHGNGDGSFSPATSHDTGFRPRAVETGDLDGDGDVDILTVNADSVDVSVLLANGLGGYVAAMSVPLPWEPWDLALGDLDSDGELDLVVSFQFTTPNMLLLGDGSGGFVAFGDYLGEREALDLIDLDGDGNLDLFSVGDFALGYIGQVAVVPGDGMGGELGPAFRIPVGGDPVAFDLADVDGDQVPDLVVASLDTDDVAVREGDGSGSFGPPIFGQGLTWGLAFADLDDDGAIDAVSAQGGLLVCRGDSSGGFAAGVVYSEGTYVREVIVGDLDGDGIPDVVEVHYLGLISVRLGLGDSTLLGALNYPTGPRPGDPVLEDLNQDGALDLLFVEWENDELVRRLNDGTGVLGPEVTIPLQGEVRYLTVSDFNGDGKPDAAVTLVDLASVSLSLGDGVGGFGALSLFPAGPYPGDVVAADFDGDGHVDLAVAGTYASQFLILRGDGIGNFDPPVAWPLSAQIHSLSTADLNGDGFNDILATIGLLPSLLQVSMNDGSGGFLPPATYGVGSSLHQMAIADLDADGDLDVGVAQSPGFVILLDRGAAIFLRGDGNGDGALDVADAVALLQALFVPTTPQLDCRSAADVNDDGLADLSDAVFLLGWLLVPGSPPPPAPFPDCGPDPTVDVLGCAATPACP